MRPEPDDEGSLSVTPERLRDTAQLFHKAASDTLDLEVSLNTDAQKLIDSMNDVLNQSPDALKRFFERWRSAMLSLSSSLDKVSDNLDAAAGGYETTDSDIGKSFGHNGTRLS